MSNSFTTVQLESTGTFPKVPGQNWNPALLEMVPKNA